MKILLRVSFYTTGDKEAFARDTTAARLNVIPFPNLGYSPETRWFFGGVALFNYRMYNDSVTRNTTFKVELNFTQNKQIIFSTEHNIFLQRNRYWITGDNSYSKFPESFWGPGNDSPPENEEKYEANRLELNNAFLKEVFSHIYLGPRIRVQHLSGMKTTEAPLLGSGTVTGYQGGLSAGAGYTFLIDSRDNILNPARGAYFSFTNLLFGKIFLSDFDFLRLELDARKYYKLKNGQVIALQWYSIANNGRPPFRMLALLGSDSHMRGYYQGRFRDRNYTSMQAEYRLKIYKAIGMVAFGGAGQVADKFSGFGLADFKPSYGLGLRIRVDKENDVNLRFDYALGKQNQGFYVVFAEAF
jgi:outer membrane protein assembly factor BamA